MNYLVNLRYLCIRADQLAPLHSNFITCTVTMVTRVIMTLWWEVKVLTFCLKLIMWSHIACNSTHGLWNTTGGSFRHLGYWSNFQFEGSPQKNIVQWLTLLQIAENNRKKSSIHSELLVSLAKNAGEKEQQAAAEERKCKDRMSVVLVGYFMFSICPFCPEIIKNILNHGMKKQAQWTNFAACRAALRDSGADLWWPNLHIAPCLFFMVSALLGPQALLTLSS